MRILQIEQGSSAWSQARLAVVTASEADSLVSPEGKVRTGVGPRSYLFRKLAEKVMGYSGDTGSTFSMDQGNVLEKIALPWFAFTYDVELTRAGFCVSDDGRCGCSPDSLIGEDGGIEIKSPTAPVHLQYLLDGVLPKDYAIQVQFSLFVTQRKWWKFVSFNKSLPALVLHVEPDAAIQKSIAEAVIQFSRSFDDALAMINRFRESENPREQSR